MKTPNMLEAKKRASKETMIKTEEYILKGNFIFNLLLSLTKYLQQEFVHHNNK